jgi:uncharacterized membrane protein YfcA
MSARLVTGTCFLAMLLTTIVSTLLHGMISHTVDMVLAVILFTGGLFGTQLGARLSPKLNSDVSRMLLAILLLSVAVMLLARLTSTPSELFMLTPL